MEDKVPAVSLLALIVNALSSLLHPCPPSLQPSFAAVPSPVRRASSLLAGTRGATMAPTSVPPCAPTRPRVARPTPQAPSPASSVSPAAAAAWTRLRTAFASSTAASDLLVLAPLRAIRAQISGCRQMAPSACLATAPVSVTQRSCCQTGTALAARPKIPVTTQPTSLRGQISSRSRSLEAISTHR